MKKSHSLVSHWNVQRRFLIIEAFFMFTYSLALTLSPAARARTWDVAYRWEHWLGFIVWCGTCFLIERQIRRHLPDADSFLFPIVSFLSGWGILTIWRLQPEFGLRQTAWFALSGLVLILGLRLSHELAFLKRYKYAWLSAGILLTTLTLFFGINPDGNGLKLWLGCCGIYLQPSEPLKLLFLVYLAGYLSSWLLNTNRLIPLIAPTTIVTAMALFLLIVQQDLGTASIFIFLFTFSLFIASGRKRVLWISLAGLITAGVAGYLLFDVVRIRVDAWLNPWLDPSGRSFQIVQSLMAIANGGIIGRGPGLGSPGLVPVSISDFIFTAIAEETGLFGTLGLISLFAIIIVRGLIIALHARDKFRRILAAGLTAYIGIQFILIVGGNTRLLPLTGVTLPFVSYGGSSLLTSFIALLLLLIISNRDEGEPAPLPSRQPYQVSGMIFLMGFLGLTLTTGWWAVWRGPDILTRTDNARRAINDRYVLRGSILDRNEQPINISKGEPSAFERRYIYPDLSSIVGYTHPNYGQSGLEASLDPYLRGLQGNPARLIWTDHLFYGQPPPGLNVRLSIDLNLQQEADFLLGNRKGAIVLLNASTGEILVMASHPTFDANLIDMTAEALLEAPDSPLLNRAAQGIYPIGNALTPFLPAAGISEVRVESEIVGLYRALGFLSEPELRLPVSALSYENNILRVSPLQMALAAATLSAEGVRPVPRLAIAVNTPVDGWVVLPSLGNPLIAFTPESTTRAIEPLIIDETPFWQFTSLSGDETNPVTWAMGGTTNSWQGSPFVVVVLLEADYPGLADYIVTKLLWATVNP